MYLLVNPNGAKYFRLDYRYNKQRKTLALGVYPETSLKVAREKRDSARELLANGTDPNDHKKTTKRLQLENANNSFKAIALEWYDRNLTDRSESHQKRTTRLLENDLFPYLGNQPIAV